MGSPAINDLLGKYWAGTSTPEEEAVLRRAFEGNPPENAARYAPLFSYLNEAENAGSEDFDLGFLPGEQAVGKPEVRRIPAWRRWGVGIAATALLALLSVMYQWPKTESVAHKPGVDEAYAQTMAALMLVSEKLNTGQASIMELSAFDKAKNQIISHENH